MVKLEQKKDVQDISTEVDKSERMEILLKGMNAISRCETIASVVNEGIKIVKLIIDADVADLLLIDREKGLFSRTPRSSQKRTENYGLPWTTQKALAQKVLETEKILQIDNLDSSEFKSSHKEVNKPVQYAVCLPMINGKNKIVGVLQIANFQKGETFNEEVITLVEMLTRHIACVTESIEQVNELESKLREDELLMTEIHHRLKNNLSTVTSLIEVDLPEITDQHAIDILRKTSSRIKSITQIHSLLYQLGTRRDVNLVDYFRKLTQKITKTLSNNIETVHITVEADPLEIDADRAMTCGLIMNELILNAYKHAFTSMQEGEIQVQLSEDEEGIIQIVVSDNGKGIGNNFAIEKKGATGCWVIKALADRLDASIDVSSKKGTRYSLRFSR